MSDETLKRLKVEITGDAGKLKKATKEAVSDVRGMSSSIRQEIGKAAQLDGGAASRTKSELQNMKQLLQSTFRLPVSGELKNVVRDVKNYVRNAQIAAGIRVPTESWEENEANIESCTQALDKLRQKEEQLKASGADQKSKSWQGVQYDIEKTIEDLDQLYAKERAMERSGKAGENKPWNDLQAEILKAEKALQRLEAKEAKMKALGADQESASWRKVQEEISQAGQRLGEYQRKKEELESSGGDTTLNVGNGASGKLRGIVATIGAVTSRIPVIGKVARASGKIMAEGFSGALAVLKKIGPAIKTAGGAFASLIQRFRQGIPLFNRWNNSASHSGDAFGRGLKSILMYGLGIRSLFALVSKLRSSLTDGMNNLSRYSSQTNASLSMLMSSLTQLRNALATAFAPILNAAAPYLNLLIRKVTDAVSAIGMLFASLTGQKAFVRAKQVSQDYAASLDKNTSSANKANQANKELQRTILGFDEINALSDHSDTSGDTSGGSDGLSPSDMFEEIPISSQINEFAKKLKDAWKKADFTEIGQIVADKLNTALENIPWSKIRNTCNKIAKSTATFLNGFLERANWGLVGQTISNGINTAFQMANTFARNFHWDSLGIAAGRGINGALEKLNWGLIRSTIRNIVSGIVDSINNFLWTANWNQIGKTIAEFFNTKLYALYTAIHKFEWKKFGSSLGELINGAVKSINANMLADTMSGALNGITDTLTHFDETIKWGQLSDKLTVGINRFLQNTHWKELGQSLSSLTKHMLEEITKAITGTDWVEVGNDIGDFLVGIDWIGIMGRIADAIKEAAKAVPQLVLGLVNAIADGIKNMTVSDWMDAINSLFSVFQAGIAIKGLKLGKDIVLSMFGGKTEISRAGGEVGATLGTAIAAKIKTTVGGVISSWGLGNLLMGAGGIAAAGTAVGALVYSASQEQNNDAIYNAYYDLQEVLGNVTQKGYLAEQTMYQLMTSARDAALSTGQLNDMYDTLAKSLISAGVPASEIRAAFDKLGISYDSLGEATKALIQNADTAGISVSRLSYSADLAAPASEKLSDALHRIAYEGGYSYRAIEEINKRMDEIRQTGGNALEQMDDFTTYLEGLGLKSDEVTRLVELFGETLDKTGKSADTAVVDMEALRASISKLSESGDILPGQMDQIMEAIQRVSETSGTSDEKVGDLKASLEGMGVSAEAQESILKTYSDYLDGMAESAGGVGKTVTETKTSMQYAAKEVETYSGTIEKAGKKSKDAGDQVGYLTGKIKGVPERKTATITADTGSAVANIAYVDERVKTIATEAGSMKASIDTSDAAGKLDLFTALKLLVMKALLNMKLTLETKTAMDALEKFRQQLAEVSKMHTVKYSLDLNDFNNLNNRMYRIGREATEAFRRGMSSVYVPTPHVQFSGYNTYTMGNSIFRTPNFGVYWYKNGGLLPASGELWGMNEAGNPEMVGKVGSGSSRTGVANNAIIAEAIKGAVVDGMMEVHMNTRSDGGGSTPIIEMTVKTDDETLYRRVLRGQQKADRRYQAVAKI